MREQFTDPGVAKAAAEMETKYQEKVKREENERRERERTPGTLEHAMDQARTRVPGMERILRVAYTHPFDKPDNRPERERERLGRLREEVKQLMAILDAVQE